MHKKTLNIASLCLVALLIVFTMTHTKDSSDKLVANIEADGEVGIVGNPQNADEYQQQIMKAVLDQNLKAFEDTSDSFKKKPTDTMTDTIAKNVFSQYIEYNTTDTLNMEKIQQETIAAVREHPAQKSNVTLQDIRISANTVEGLKSYANTVAAIQNNLYKAVDKIKDKTEATLYLQNLYNVTSDLYLKLAVPESMSREHVAIINAYRDYYTSFDLLKLQDSDPARALTGVQLAKEAQDALVASLESVKKIVLLNNITYTEGDAAFVWFTNATGTEMIKTN
ncbi:MAG: hypothetical protein V4576_03525 [Patescibacteria group bacterium]